MSTAAPIHHPQSDFVANGNTLLVGGIPLDRLTARVGQTPYYVYDRAVIKRNVARLRSFLPRAISLDYAVKANPMPAVVGFLASLTDGADVASAREMHVALNAGFSAQRISFAGPGKSAADITMAVAAEVILCAESLRDIEIALEAADRHGVTPRIALRLNPDFELKSSGMKMGGGPKQFGIDAESASPALERLKRAGLPLHGLHIFSGSQNLNPESIREAQTQAVALARRICDGLERPIEWLNIGGGFGIPYFPGEKPLDLTPIAENLNAVTESMKSSMPATRLVLELGRYLVGNAGIYVCRILDRKISRGETYLVTDGGLHHHLAASGNFGQVLRKNYPVCIGTRMNEPATGKSSIVGPLCTPLDLLADRMSLPEAMPGDLVCVFQSGAYGRTASPMQFLSHPEPSEILV